MWLPPLTEGLGLLDRLSWREKSSEESPDPPKLVRASWISRHSMSESEAGVKTCSLRRLKPTVTSVIRGVGRLGNRRNDTASVKNDSDKNLTFQKHR